MFIEVVRSGGVAGLTRRARVDLDTLGDEAAIREWRILVDQARPLLAMQPPSTRSSRRDGFVWTVSVGDATCQVDDSSIPGPLRDLAQRTLREGRRL